MSFDQGLQELNIDLTEIENRVRIRLNIETV